MSRRLRGRALIIVNVLDPPVISDSREARSICIKFWRMVSAGITQVMAGCQLFAGLPQRDHRMIAEVAERREVRDELIVRRGEKAAHLFLLIKGNAKYYRVTKTGQEVLLWWLKPGDVFGLATLLKDAPGYIGTAEPISRCELLVWKHAAIRQLASTFPLLYQNALGITLHYLSRYATRHEAIISNTAEQRLAHALIHLAHRSGQRGRSEVEVNITNEHLGKLADVGLFTATRLLSRWQGQGAIAKTRGKILIRCPEKLPID